MSANFDWNSIPGVHHDTGHNQAANTPATDHFDDFFNKQLNQAHSIGNMQDSPTSHVQFPSHTVAAAQTPVPALSVQGVEGTFNTGNHSDSSLSHVFNNLKLGNSSISRSDDTINTIKTLQTNTNTMSSLHKVMENPKHSSSADTVVAEGDSSISLSLTINDMSPRELKTYLRWYENIQERKAMSKIVTIEDVFLFLQNFKIPEAIKERMKSSFSKWSNSLNIGQFFALMRLLAHALLGKPLTRSLVKVPAPIPNPIPILTRKRKESPTTSTEGVSHAAKNVPKKKLDIDSFTEFILTGERPQGVSQKNANKKVKFSEVVSYSPSPAAEETTQASAYMVSNPPQQHVIDFSLPMNQLLDKLRGGSSQTSQPANAAPVQQQPPAAAAENEDEVLKDVQMDTFKNITQKAVQNTNDEMQPLKPNLTGSASKSMKEHFMQQFEQTFNFNNTQGALSTMYSDISGLSAAASPTNTQSTVSPPKAAAPLVMPNAYSSPQPQPQMFPEPHQYGTQTQHQGGDYFAFTPQVAQPTTLGSPYLNSGPSNGALNPPPPPPSRSRGSSVSSPPPVPPPPRSRKSSRATSTSAAIPPPAAGHANPALPPKPMLSDKQKKQFLSITDDVSSPAPIMNGLNPMPSNFNPQYNNGNMSLGMNMPGPNNLHAMNTLNNVSTANGASGMGGMANMGQINQLNQLTQMSQLSSPLQVPGLPNYGNSSSAMLYNTQGSMQQPGVTPSPQFAASNSFINQATSPGWPPQQPQQNLQPQQTASTNWSAWQT